MEYDIKDVAFYLRKSRGEGEKDLEKHRSILADLAKKNNWRYVEYLEIASSENIEFRPKFQLLLKDINDGMYDAVAVVDYDRLGRGDLKDQAEVKEILINSETLIVTPEKIYNPMDESDDLMIDVKGLLARQEYKSIKKRMVRGKKIGARRGNWTNGTPPFPYIYNPSTKGLLVHSEKVETYRLMKDLFFSGESMQGISWYINNLGIRSPKNKYWRDNTIRRILMDETHLGKIISNKSEGSAHKNKKTKKLKYYDPSEWVIVENCHEILKTPEEHNEIISQLRTRTRFHPAERRGAFIFSGIIFCSKCGKSINMQDKGLKAALIKACRKADPFGNKCDNKGNKLSTVIEAVKHLLKKETIRLKAEEETSNMNYVDYEKLIHVANEKISKVHKAISRIKDMYEEGDYSKEEYQERHTKRKADINKLEAEIIDYQLLLQKQSDMTKEQKIKKFEDIISIIDSESVETATKNALLKEIIEKIIYNKDNNGDVPQVEVLFK
ncbi:recombinase family protein [Paenibacillus polymyxa]|uniref:recombinase family protein n=1 Tax=Paenibacillus polymyxa TaxID=1406 RepID=UPI002AB4BA6B|nr:recombinase family protein [Paenibacillus polymyxa]MDY8023408.1 recombinase family protein [Paenibacillus polymyxa]